MHIRYLFSFIMLLSTSSMFASAAAENSSAEGQPKVSAISASASNFCDNCGAKMATEITAMCKKPQVDHRPVIKMVHDGLKKIAESGAQSGDTSAENAGFVFRLLVTNPGEKVLHNAPYAASARLLAKQGLLKGGQYSISAEHTRYYYYVPPYIINALKAGNVKFDPVRTEKNR